MYNCTFLNSTFLDAISISIVGHVGHSQGTIFEIYDETNEILDLMRPKET